jgi:quercetin dioxygenase-like cupin family protein
MVQFDRIRGDCRAVSGLGQVLIKNLPSQSLTGVRLTVIVALPNGKKTQRLRDDQKKHVFSEMAPMTRPAAIATKLLEDDQVCVTRFDFAPGAQTGWHRHAMDYIITAITPCTMLLEEPGGGTRTVTVPAGEAYRRDAGVEHNVINAGAEAMAFVELELKQSEENHGSPR